MQNMVTYEVRILHRSIEITTHSISPRSLLKELARQAIGEIVFTPELFLEKFELEFVLPDNEV